MNLHTSPMYLDHLARFYPQVIRSQIIKFLSDRKVRRVLCLDSLNKELGRDEKVLHPFFPSRPNSLLPPFSPFLLLILLLTSDVKACVSRVYWFIIKTGPHLVRSGLGPGVAIRLWLFWRSRHAGENTLAQVNKLISNIQILRSSPELNFNILCKFTQLFFRT